MNDFDGFARGRGKRWFAMLRLARDGEPKPLLNKGGSPVVFVDELSATKAALEHVLAYFNGHLVSSRDIAGGNIRIAKFQKAERLLFKKGRAIKVENAKGSIIRE
jgi:hypothetical protein